MTEYLHPTLGWISATSARLSILALAEKAEALGHDSTVCPDFLRRHWATVAARPNLWKRHWDALGGLAH